MSKSKTYKIQVIIKNNNQGTLQGPLVVLNKLYNEFKVKHPNAWHITMFSKGRNSWDGYIKYITDSGSFKLGLLPMIVERLEELGHKVKVIDLRETLDVIPKVPKKVGKLTLRDYQYEAIKRVVENKVKGVPYYIGVQNLATNAGKTSIMVGVYLAFNRLPTILLTNDSDWFNQAKREFKELLPNEKVGFIQGSKATDWQNFNICMVQTLARNIQKFQPILAKQKICLVDEADLADNKTYKTVIQHLYNTSVRLGLSGTIYMSKLKKDLVHNMNLRSFFGDELMVISKKQLMDKGFSTPIVVKIIPGLDFSPMEYNTEYRDIYNQVVSDPKRNEICLQRLLYNLKYGRKPALVVTQYINHCEELYKYLKSKLDKRYSIAFVHHKTKDRDKIIQSFREGYIDILVSTFIIKRGKNFPLLRYLQNAAGSNSNENISQLMGRLERKNKGKTKTYMDDIYDKGEYLSRHSKHRKNYYIKEKVKVIDLTKKKEFTKSYPF